MYIKLSIGSYTIHHGYDENNKEIVEKVEVEQYMDKIIKVDRIQSYTEKTVLISSGFGREMYWEYAGGLELIEKRLKNLGLLVD